LPSFSSLTHTNESAPGRQEAPAMVSNNLTAPQFFATE
jgi:hypothetical protein